VILRNAGNLTYGKGMGENFLLYSLFSADIWSIFQINMLPFLFRLEVKACDCDQKKWYQTSKNTHESSDQDSF
jgi:hypothetical protein